MPFLSVFVSPYYHIIEIFSIISPTACLVYPDFFSISPISIYTYRLYHCLNPCKFDSPHSHSQKSKFPPCDHFLFLLTSTYTLSLYFTGKLELSSYVDSFTFQKYCSVFSGSIFRKSSFVYVSYTPTQSWWGLS